MQAQLETARGDAEAALKEAAAAKEGVAHELKQLRKQAAAAQAAAADAQKVRCSTPAFFVTD